MVDRVLLGKRNDGTYGLDISKAGQDVKTAQLADLAFSTKWGHAANILLEGTVSSYLSNNVTFPFTLGYVPLVLLNILSDYSGGVWNKSHVYNWVRGTFGTDFFPCAGTVTPSGMQIVIGQTGYGAKYMVFAIPAGA